MPAIRATNSKNITVNNCTFRGFNTDIVIENCEGFVSINNSFSKDDPRNALNSFLKEIKDSDLDSDHKKELFKEAMDLLANTKSINNFKAKEKSLALKIGQYVGNKAVDFFVQLTSAVLAGYIVIKSK